MKTQNSGATLVALTSSFASSKDQNPVMGDVSYYGAIREIIKVVFDPNLALFSLSVIDFIQKLMSLGLHKSISSGYVIKMTLLY